MTYASFWKRVGAYLIDGFIYSILIFFICFILALCVGMDTVLPAMSGALGRIVGVVGWIFYYACQESSPWQTTIGKRIFGLKVTDLNGQRISFWRAIGRVFGFYVSMLILYVGFLMCLWTEKKQCLHDMMAGCLVVDETPNEKQGCAIGIVVCLFILPLVLGILAAIALPQYMRAMERTVGNMAVKNLEAARKAQHAYYKEHNQYATRWSQLNFVEECNNEESNRCTLTNLFTFELEPEGVAAQRENPVFSYRLFRAYDLNDTQRNLVCVPKDDRTKAFCQQLMER